MVRSPGSFLLVCMCVCVSRVIKIRAKIQVQGMASAGHEAQGLSKGAILRASVDSRPGIYFF